MTPTNVPGADEAVPAASEGVDARLAEAARYAVLGRVLPVLRHDVAGSLQPVKMLLAVLERRVQNTDPDLVAIKQGVLSLSALTKQAAADCMSALRWTDSNEDLRVSMRVGVDEAARVLAMEMSENHLSLTNCVVDDSAAAPRGFFRTVLVGALLAFCDQSVASGTLEVTFQEAATDSQHTGQLQMRMLPGGASSPLVSRDGLRRSRAIGWPDVQAMATSCSVRMARGDGWLTLDLPRQ